MYDVIIIGAGPAGLSAAIYARRAGQSVLLLEGGVFGGQIVNTPEVENYPGIRSIAGAELAYQLYEHATGLGAELVSERAVSADLVSVPKKVTTESAAYEARAVIVANGAKRRTVGCPGEAEFTGRGVSYCAACDGAFFRGREVAVVGGGNTALEDALYLAALCSRVHLLHRRDAFRGGEILARRVAETSNIVVHWNTVPAAITGSDRVEGVTLRDTLSGAESALPVSGVFVAIGLAPDNEMFRGQLELDKAGYIVAGEDCRTNIPGVWAAGDTRTKALRQVVTAAADGAVAGNSAADRL